MMEQILYHYLAQIHDNPVIFGRVLNVGLGEGHTARLLLNMRFVSQVVSVEKDYSVIAQYQQRHKDDIEKLHLIDMIDAAVMHPVGKFNFIIMDILSNDMDTMRQASLRAKEVMHSESYLMWEFWSDSPEERALLEWLKENFRLQITRMPLNTTARGRGGMMSLFRLP